MKAYILEDVFLKEHIDVFEKYRDAKIARKEYIMDADLIRCPWLNPENLKIKKVDIILKRLHHQKDYDPHTITGIFHVNKNA